MAVLPCAVQYLGRRQVHVCLSVCLPTYLSVGGGGGGMVVFSYAAQHFSSKSIDYISTVYLPACLFVCLEMEGARDGGLAVPPRAVQYLGPRQTCVSVFVCLLFCQRGKHCCAVCQF